MGDSLVVGRGQSIGHGDRVGEDLGQRRLGISGLFAFFLGFFRFFGCSYIFGIHKLQKS